MCSWYTRERCRGRWPGLEDLGRHDSLRRRRIAINDEGSRSRANDQQRRRRTFSFLRHFSDRSPILRARSNVGGVSMPVAEITNTRIALTEPIDKWGCRSSGKHVVIWPGIIRWNHQSCPYPGQCVDDRADEYAPRFIWLRKRCGLIHHLDSQLGDEDPSHCSVM